jgi:hypothetical protein
MQNISFAWIHKNKSQLVSKKTSATDVFMELLNSRSTPYLTGFFLRLNNTKIENKKREMRE